jgi:hypothetical protein
MLLLGFDAGGSNVNITYRTASHTILVLNLPEYRLIPELGVVQMSKVVSDEA